MLSRIYSISDTETELKDKIEECESDLTNIEKELNILVVNKNMTYLEISQKPSEYKELMSITTKTNVSIHQYTDMKRRDSVN